MRHFRKPGPITRLSLEARLVYSGFCVFILLGFFSSAWLYLDDGLQHGSVAVQEYYRGSEFSAPTAAVPQPADEGVAIVLPDELARPVVLSVGLSRRQVMETFHFHLFSVSVVLLILGHLFMMCGYSLPFKAGVIGLSFAVTFIHLLVPPWLHLTGSGVAAALMLPTAVLMGGLWLLMTVAPLWQMWTAPRA